MKKVSVIVILAVFVLTSVSAFAGGIDSSGQCETKADTTRSTSTTGTTQTLASKISGSFQKAADSVAAVKDSKHLSLRENKSELMRRRSPKFEV